MRLLLHLALLLGQSVRFATSTRRPSVLVVVIIAPLLLLLLLLAKAATPFVVYPFV